VEPRTSGRRHWAVRDVSFRVDAGEVLGIVGRNGAGKSTLLQLVCGTLRPSEGELNVRGRIAALLELGAGFNPDFTGIENVYLNAALLGLTQAQVDARLDGILAFADIGDFVHQPVKTYSSGMFVRLAFAVATSVDPQLLVIDEALSVGDGAFARKSFERVMQLRDNGASILLCSHSVYHVQALCNRALWLDRGQVRGYGPAASVTASYETALVADMARAVPQPAPSADPTSPKPNASGARWRNRCPRANPRHRQLDRRRPTGPNWRSAVARPRSTCRCGLPATPACRHRPWPSASGT
jgi:lipopolysaccharide transport system ATP-binding protein